jgi:hypothetical protein
MISKSNCLPSQRQQLSFAQQVPLRRKILAPPEQRAGCAPDAFRLCALRQNKSDLSDACRLVFEQSAGPVASRSK